MIFFIEKELHVNVQVSDVTSDHTVSLVPGDPILFWPPQTPGTHVAHRQM